MSNRFNNEAMNLEILAEEAAEIIQAKSKAVRFGIDDYHPKNGVPNREKLEEEIGHLLGIIDVLIDNGTLDQLHIALAKSEKILKMEKWYFRTKDGSYNGHAVIDE